jgi:hypothetical protein
LRYAPRIQRLRQLHAENRGRAAYVGFRLGGADRTERLGASDVIGVGDIVLPERDGLPDGMDMSTIREPADLHRFAGCDGPDQLENAACRGLSNHNELTAALIQPSPLLRRRLLSGVKREQVQGMTARGQERNEVRDGHLICAGHWKRQPAAHKGNP